MASFADELQRALGSAYQLDRELTGGGMSRVFVATDRSLGRTVVVKVLPPELAAGVNRERFRREIQLAAQLQHPHIVPLLSAGESGELLWYTMPYMEGQSLRSVLERDGKLAVRDVVRILHDVVDALAYAHARGVIHRDIKPANILTQGAHALVTDFGVAKALSAALPATGLTTGGIAIGTPAYMAPEQLAGDPSADSRMDLYAVGLLAYELLVGESPFTGTSPREKMAAQLTADPKPLDQLRPEVPGSLSAIIARCLAKDPEARPASASEVLAAIDALALSPVTPHETRATPPKRRAAAIVGVVAAVAASIAAAMAYTSYRGAETTLPAAVQPPLSGDSALGKTLAANEPSSAPVNTAALDSQFIKSYIAELMDKQERTNRTKDSISRARYEDSVRTFLADSINTAVRANAQRFSGPGPRGVIVMPAPDQRRNPITAAAAESLRQDVSQNRRLVLSRIDSFPSMIGRPMTQPNVAVAAGGNMVVQVQVVGPGDSSKLKMTVVDPFGRGGAHIIESAPMLRRDLLKNIDGVLDQTMKMLDSMTRGRRGGGRGGFPLMAPVPPPAGTGSAAGAATAGGTGRGGGDR